MKNNSNFREFIYLIREIFQMLINRKSMWLAPLVFALLLVGAGIVVLEGSVFAPLIYTIF